MYDFCLSREISTYPIKKKQNKKSKTNNKWKTWYKMAEISSNLIIKKNPNGLNLPI